MKIKKFLLVLIALIATSCATRNISDSNYDDKLILAEFLTPEGKRELLRNIYKSGANNLSVERVYLDWHETAAHIGGMIVYFKPYHQTDEQMARQTMYCEATTYKNPNIYKELIDGFKCKKLRNRQYVMINKVAHEFSAKLSSDQAKSVVNFLLSTDGENQLKRKACLHGAASLAQLGDGYITRNDNDLFYANFGNRYLDIREVRANEYQIDSCSFLQY